MTVSPPMACLPHGDQRGDAWGQIEVRAAAEADHAETLAGLHVISGADVTQDAAGDQAGDLDHGDGLASGKGEGQRVAFVFVAGLIVRGVEEAAGVIGDGAWPGPPRGRG